MFTLFFLLESKTEILINNKKKKMHCCQTHKCASENVHKTRDLWTQQTKI